MISTGPGRPRDESIDKKVMDATLDIVNEEGLGGLSVDAIAGRAGVSKATIYRRWDTKEELLVDTVAGLVDDVTIAHTGDIRSDLIAAVDGMLAFLTTTRAGDIFPWLVGEIASQSELGSRYARAVIVPKREMLGRVIAGAMAQDELRADLEVTTAVDMLIGPVLMRQIAGMLGGVGSDWSETLVDCLLEGWAVD